MHNIQSISSLVSQIVTSQVITVRSTLVSHTLQTSPQMTISLCLNHMWLHMICKLDSMCYTAKFAQIY